MSHGVLRFFFGLLVIGAAFRAQPARADLFSPGELATPHADLEGLSNCTKCHEAGEQLSPKACLACHSELKPRIDSGAGFHGRLKAEDRNCERCHHEHQGRAFELIDWKGGQKAFDHKEAGWVLAGAHKKAECTKCHETRLVADQGVRKWLSDHPAMKGSFLGLPNECARCHFDEHRGQESSKCESCHNETAWKPAPKFDHQKTSFALEGKHRNVTCEKCHSSLDDSKTQAGVFPAPKAAQYVKFKDVAHGACSDCHKDPHSGAFGASCSSCHTVEDWKQVRTSSMNRSFHDNTRYPLRGAHANVACEKCHPGTPMKTKGISFGACTDCHSDAHDKQLLTKTGEIAACDTCHTVEAFKPTRFTVSDHARSLYPLEGRHAQVACTLCHYEKQAARSDRHGKRSKRRQEQENELVSAVVFRLPEFKQGCLGCHSDGHAGQLTKDGRPQRCEDCHTVAAFSPARYELEDHAQSRYPLEGAHRVVPCNECHAPNPDLRKAAPTAMQALIKRGGHLLVSALTLRPQRREQGCIGCHSDPHAGQFQAAVSKGGCESCHVETSFTDLKRFDHARDTNYPLTGKHAKAKCESCHVPDDHGLVRYRPLEQSCGNCHRDVHVGQFADAGGRTDCVRCHATQDFHTVSFVHAPPFTNYRLEGKHARVQCQECHRKVTVSPGVETVRYRPLPNRCEFCHADEHRGTLSGVQP